MTKKDDAEITREASNTIFVAIKENRRQEWAAIGVILSLFLVGLGLLIYAAICQRWQFILSGGMIQVTIILPLRWLINLREENRTLQILPQLMRLAQSKQAKALAAELVRRLISRVSFHDKSHTSGPRKSEPHFRRSGLEPTSAGEAGTDGTSDSSHAQCLQQTTARQ